MLSRLFHPKGGKDPQRFYLLPGQGGRAYRRKQKAILFWSILTALTGSAILGALLYWLDRL